jgi:hypothetical protein
MPLSCVVLSWHSERSVPMLILSACQKFFDDLERLWVRMPNMLACSSRSLPTALSRSTIRAPAEDKSDLIRRSVYMDPRLAPKIFIRCRGFDSCMPTKPDANERVPGSPSAMVRSNLINLNHICASHHLPTFSPSHFTPSALSLDPPASPVKIR